MVFSGYAAWYFVINFWIGSIGLIPVSEKEFLQLLLNEISHHFLWYKMPIEGKDISTSKLNFSKQIVVNS